MDRRFCSVDSCLGRKRRAIVEAGHSWVVVVSAMTTFALVVSSILQGCAFWRSEQELESVASIKEIVKDARNCQEALDLKKALSNIAPSRSIREQIHFLLHKKDSTMDDIIKVCNETNDNVVGGFAAMELRFIGLEMKFDGLERKFDGLDKKIDDLAIDTSLKFDDLSMKFDALSAKLDAFMAKA